MIVKDLAGKESKWKMKCKADKKKSALHLKAVTLIKDIYPNIYFVEEVAIKILRNKTLYLDIFIPLNNLAIEVNGEQHYKYISMFHTHKLEWLKQVKNDNEKREWCEINNIKLIELSYKESIDEWREKFYQ